jgi:hypothetical protein
MPSITSQYPGILIWIRNFGVFDLNDERSTFRSGADVMLL